MELVTIMIDILQIMDGEIITKMRTAAASAVAFKVGFCSNLFAGFMNKLSVDLCSA